MTGFASEPEGEVVTLRRAIVEASGRGVSLSRIPENIRSIGRLPAPQKPDGLLQMLWWTLRGLPLWPSNIKVETISGWGVAILSAQLFYQDGGLLLRGKLGRTGVTIAEGHVDIREPD